MKRSLRNFSLGLWFVSTAALGAAGPRDTVIEGLGGGLLVRATAKMLTVHTPDRKVVYRFFIKKETGRADRFVYQRKEEGKAQEEYLLDQWGEHPIKDSLNQVHGIARSYGFPETPLASAKTDRIGQARLAILRLDKDKDSYRWVQPWLRCEFYEAKGSSSLYADLFTNREEADGFIDAPHVVRYWHLKD